MSDLIKSVVLASLGVLSLTMRCNLSCIGCYAASYTKSDDLELDQIDRIIEEGNHCIFFLLYLFN